MLDNRYEKSQRLLERAEKVIPLGSQTFSKSKIQYPEGHAPLYIKNGLGGHVWDVDGNEYVDLICGLMPVLLGYCDPDVDKAINEQLENGITFSLATELEVELAERLVDIIPCAEMVRFGKNGSDATSAAVRLARAYTGRDHIITCGYHGWQDWYIGATTRSKGVPSSVRELTHRVSFNDIDAVRKLLENYHGNVAALIMEPMNAVEPYKGYFEELKILLHSYGALLIFDEVITGFRYSEGGAQQLFGVIPDLSSFGKSMGNGMPISAVVGRTDIMHEMEEIFFSSTFGGETLSLAAAIATIDKIRRENVIDRIWDTGSKVADAVRSKIDEHGLSGVINLVGKAPWTILQFLNHPNASGDALKTLFLREMLANGVLLLGSNNICFAHDSRDITHIEKAYSAAFKLIGDELQVKGLDERLGIPLIRPVFSVRS